MTDPAFTVLLPVYNGMPYLRDAVESVLAQDFTDYELLVINDGSTDGSEAYLRSIADPRIRIVSRENRGLIATLNEGLALSGTDLILRFDADDVCLPGRFRTQFEYMQAHPECNLLGGDIEYIDKDGRKLMEFSTAGHSYEELLHNLYTECPLVHSAVMYRRKAVMEGGGYADGALTFEDHLLWAKMLQQGQGCNLRQAMIQVRFNPESVTVDEKWRGPDFARIKLRSIRRGFVTPEDAEGLRMIVRGQDLRAFKEASYYSMMGKKYLWNVHDPKLARKHLREAMRRMPGKAEPYLLYLLSFLPGNIVRGLYKRLKGTGS